MDPVELDVARANTLAFIAANPFTVTLQPRDRVVTGTGAVWNNGTLRPPQIARLIDTNAVGGLSVGLGQTADGQQEKQAFQLLLPYDGAVAPNDTFTYGGLRHDVIELLPANGYELRASVVRYG